MISEPICLRAKGPFACFTRPEFHVERVSYAWTQELFCDAVGLTMAGPAYAFAFSDYGLRLDRGDFVLSPLDLAYSSHPVTWLRIRVLVQRARTLGFLEAANTLEERWDAVAGTLQVKEDYFGYFEDAWAGSVESTLNDMLTETAPRACNAHEAEAPEEWQPGMSPVFLLNRGWKVARDKGADVSDYDVWEPAAVGRFLADTVPDG